MGAHRKVGKVRMRRNVERWQRLNNVRELRRVRKGRVTRIDADPVSGGLVTRRSPCDYL
jgi:hypothetical protein